MAEVFEVVGLCGRPALSGTIPVRGAKNAVLKALAAGILFEDGLGHENVPAIEDVARMRELIDAAQDSTGAWQPTLKKEVAERLRASIVVTGPLLARLGEVHFPYPGGCVLGERPIDVFLDGFRAMGALVEESGGNFSLRAPRGKLQGAHIVFPFMSVTGTETLMLAATLAAGETILENAAMEPEIGYLAQFLNSCGAHISGIGTPVLHIQGGGLLQSAGKKFVTPPDRIETGSFIILAALLGKEVMITQCEPAHTRALTVLLRHAGVSIEEGECSITVRAPEKIESFSVRTHEYPGFPTDLQAPIGVLLTQAHGEGTISETIFDGRFRYVDDVVRMGADITVMNPHRILIRGPRALSATVLESPDLRAGLAYILAAAVAKGTSTIRNAYVIDRGYERIEERLQKLGLTIMRKQV
jgi:UDP-N-acetylglucosamine 1-carboxyvinyltransferase